MAGARDSRPILVQYARLARRRAVGECFDVAHRSIERPSSRARAAGIHGDRARALGRASVSGVSDLRAGLAGAESARHARHDLSVVDQVGASALSLRPRHARGTLALSSRLHRREGSPLVDDRAGDSVLASHRAPSLDHSGHRGPQPDGPPGADEPDSALDSARRTSPLLQQHRLRPDDHRDVLPPVSTGGGARHISLRVRLGQRSQGERRIDLLQWPIVGPFLRWRHSRTTIQLVLLLAAALVVIDGLYAASLDPTTFTTVAVWTHYRGLLVVGLLAVGNLFCAGCPFVLARDAGRRLLPP